MKHVIAALNEIKFMQDSEQEKKNKKQKNGKK